MADLARARRFAQAELKRPRPRLEDAWIPHLDALGLGPAIERWKVRHGAATGGGRDLAGVDPAELFAGPRFTGRGRGPFVGPPDWVSGLYVFTEEEEDAEPDEAAGRGDTPR